MVMLYLLVRVLLPLLAAGIVAWALARVVHRQASRLPPQRIPLPDQSQLAGKAAQRRYRRMRRRNPNRTHLTRPAPVPRLWTAGMAMATLAALVITVVLTPDGARFQVMVESMTGYPATIVAVRVPAGQQDALLRAWQPVLAQATRQVRMRYPVARTGGEYEARAEVPVRVHREGDVLEVAAAVVVESESLRSELARRGGLPREAIAVRQQTLAPMRERGWTPLHAASSPGR